MSTIGAMLARVQALNVQTRELHQGVEATLTEALRLLLVPGSMVYRSAHRMHHKDKTFPYWASSVMAVAGRDHNATRFELTTFPSVKFDFAHPELSTWTADAYPINEQGKRLSARSGGHSSRDREDARVQGRLINPYELDLRVESGGVSVEAVLAEMFTQLTTAATALRQRMETTT